MKWKPRVIIAGVIVVVSLVLTTFGINTFVQTISLLAAGYLFGTAQAATKESKGGK